MPLARITTPLPEYFERLAQDLRARGFDVETASPGQFFTAAADLEITVKQCASEDAAKLAASSSKDMCVLVAPGAKDGGIHSIEMIVLQPKAQTVASARHLVTPAQVIEISSALIGANSPQPQPDHPKISGEVKNWPKVKAATQSSWEEISGTTSHWMESATSAGHAGWEAVKQSVVPVKEFLLEIGQETKELGRRLAGVLMARRRRRMAAKEDEQLVPSIFALSGEERFGAEAKALDDQAVVEISERRPRPKLGDRRFLKAAGTAAIAAVALLLAISVVNRPRHAPIPASESVVENNSTLPASVGLKPSAMIERGGQTNPGSPSVRMVAAKQALPNDPEAEDTVVRYRSRPTAPKHVDSHPQVKRYSDLD